MGNVNLKKFKKKSRYDVAKRNKADNFSFLNQNYCKTHQTVLVGDSITEICNMELYAGYSQRNNILVYNRGISGDTSDRLLERLNDNVLCLEPENIVILIGTNDFAIGANAEYVFSNIREIVSACRKTCPEAKIILQAVYPVGKQYRANRFRSNANIAKLNKLLPSLAREYDVILLDLTKALSDEHGEFDKTYTYDGLHPNVKGLEIAAKKITELLEK